MTAVSVRTRSVRGAVRRRRARPVVVVLALAVLLTAVALLVVGDFVVPLPEVIGVITGRADWKSQLFVLDIRLPRVLTGLLAGLGFGMSGAIFQSLVRNPLASPDVIGITSGASAAAATCIVALGLGGMAVSAGALAGALVTAVAIYLLSWRGGLSGQRLVLVGIGATALLSSLVSYLMTSAAVWDAQQVLIWLTGSLSGRTWTHTTTLACCLVPLALAAAALARPLNVLCLGDDLARGLGLWVERSRLALLLTGVGLAATATAAAGPVAFVALVSAPVARRLVRDGGPALAASALVGALVTLVSDFVAEHAFTPVELPVGVVTGVVGGPYLLVLLVTANRAGTSASRRGSRLLR
ncbi:iron chelate uptake ABC transporter family permease subunit [Streptomyces rimosus]|uniref:Iron chelate uptake ABC transporter family permease subunit n=2 Tax=Streptomyces rimosus subsp. rimosus TaxID=132474 RepID=A0A8A1UJD1_STRR1|nr:MULTISPECIES: iron chelate uptake ABC transporter family permease subunit [Streptomyces]MYT48139.1 iron chelate uptake ABC transporter family permease subunit [Streptomyces sp. SID5471]QDA08927.1 iron ABC transporter [Streptomyces rimosus]QEV80206.1 iron ABC transporter permease [Streptomyces rimosus]QST79032.1 iron chelate uptake ABC transporter family permease subunit [Streptomyces rimosus subsp. rimosus ATCC 10970]QTL91073.1 iron chelate uptake ABC transporter family permease subunit [St